MDRKKEILKHTASLIKKKGYEAFSYNDLSKALNITKASVHHHFPTKEDLGVSFLMMILEEYGYKLEVIYLSNASPREKLEKMFDQAAEVIKRNQDEICPISSLLSDLLVLPDKMKFLLDQLVRMELNYFEKVLSEGRKVGQFRFKGSTESHALLVLSVFKGVIQHSRLLGYKNYGEVMNQLMINL